MDRALREFPSGGVACNLQFLENVINHPAFGSGEVTTRFVDTTPELLAFAKRRDRATKLPLRYLGELAVNGYPGMAGHTPPSCALPPVPQRPRGGQCRRGAARHARPAARELGPEKFSRWMLDQKQVLLTDTTMRDRASVPSSATRTAHRRHAADRSPFYARTAAAVLAGMPGWRHLPDVASAFPGRRTRGSGWRNCASGCRVLFQMPLRGSNGSPTPTMPTTWCASSSSNSVFGAGVDLSVPDFASTTGAICARGRRRGAR
ncbi:hypothetical protein ACU4GD_36750 [Cupriavidus basilensis]